MGLLVRRVERYFRPAGTNGTFHSNGLAKSGSIWLI